MNFLMNIGLKALGLQSALDAVNGETSKAYLGGLGLILGGLGSILAGAAGIVQGLLPLHTGAEYLAFAQGIEHNASAGLILAGWVSVSKGYSAIGQRHALAKLQNAATGVPLPNATPGNAATLPPAQ